MNKETITITHDYTHIFKISQPFFKNKFEDLEINNSIDINNYSLLITQHNCNKDVFDKIYKKNIHVETLPYYYQKDKHISSRLNLNIIIVFIIGNIIDLKGKEILINIINYYKTHSSNVKIVVFGYTLIDNFIDHYYYNSISELNHLLIKHKPNILLELSLWPETYSYTLTLSMLTNLPILYYKKDINCVVKSRLQMYINAIPFSLNNIYDYHQLDKLIKQNFKTTFFTIKPILYYSPFWNNLFINQCNKYNVLNKVPNNNFKYNITPYFIYFPQYHEMEENNRLFYKKFTDINNLDKFKKTYNDLDLYTPSLKELNLNNTTDYDLKNVNLIQNPIDIINEYGFNGFAIYYYWFTKNSITNKNELMEEVIDNFFKDSVNLYDKKVFFIWANEDWTNNAAFGNGKSNINIINEYNSNSFIKNINYLMKYFLHPNYLKINNKPVFFIYHPWLISNIDLFHKVLDNYCKLNNFSGIHLVLNSFNQTYKNYKNFYINFNYKNNDCRHYCEKKKQIVLDYKKYINDSHHSHAKPGIIKTIVFDFDNRPRLYLPNKLANSTICINNTEFDKILFMNKIIDSYERNELVEEESIDNILLINAWNEWGEKMAFEPSEEYGYYYLNLLYDYLKK